MLNNQDLALHQLLLKPQCRFGRIKTVLCYIRFDVNIHKTTHLNKKFIIYLYYHIYLHFLVCVRNKKENLY